METDESKSCSSCAGWRLPLLLALVLAAIVLSRVIGDSVSSSSVAEESKPELASGAAREQVSLVIDFGNGQRKEFDAVAWREGMTVAELMPAASGELALNKRGSGQSAFLVSIDEVANEGAGGKNWTYEVNGNTADRSFAVYELRPGDRVLWTFGPRR